MVIYADILFITNLYVDFLLLYCVKAFLHLKTGTIRLLFGALAGALCSLSALLPGIPPAVSLLTGIIGAALTTAAAFLPLKAGMYIKATASFWVLSFCFAGFFLFLCNFLSPKNLAVINGNVYFNLSPLMLFGMTLAAYLLLCLFRRFFVRSEPGIRFARIRITHNGNSAELFAKADTGNSLHEPFSGLPVLIAEAAAVKDIMPEAAASFLNGSDPTGKIRLIPYDGITGGGILPAFKPDDARFHKSTKPFACYIAVCEKKLSAGQFNALFNPDVLPQELLHKTEQKKLYSTEQKQNGKHKISP